MKFNGGKNIYFQRLEKRGNALHFGKRTLKIGGAVYQNSLGFSSRVLIVQVNEKETTDRGRQRGAGKIHNTGSTLGRGKVEEVGIDGNQKEEWERFGALFKSYTAGKKS